jgi:hypothetical protein
VSLRYSDVVLKDFSGGISDNYLNMPLNRYEIGDNVFIKEDRSFEERYGSITVFDRDISAAINYMRDLNDEIICVRDSLVYLFDENLGTLTQADRPQAGSSVWENTIGFNSISSDQWQDQLIVTHSGNEAGDALNRPMRVYRDNVGDLKLGELGMFGLTDDSIENVTTGIEILRGDNRVFEYYEKDRSKAPPANASLYAHSYIYAFIYSYEYETERSKYRVVSPVQITSILYTDQPINGTPATGLLTADATRFTKLPVPSVTGTQIDISNVTLEIYRTVSGGTDFFKAAEVPVSLITGPTFDLLDIFQDGQLVTREPLYISGGILDRFPAPKSKYLKVVNDTAYWGYVADEDSGDVKPFRVLQGFSGIIDSHDPAAYVDLDDEVVGIGEASGFAIVFTKSETYRLEGSFNNTGGGSLRPRTISETAGCVSHNCIVSANNNIYWIGDNAVYATNGYKVEKIPSSIDLLKTIRSFTNTEEKRRTVIGQYDEDNERVVWAVNENESNNTRWLVLNLNTGGFTTGSNVPSSSLLFLNDDMYRADELGYIYKHSLGVSSDPVRDTAAAIENWGTTHVEWLWKSVGIDFGDPSITNWVSHISPYLQSETNYGVRIGVDCDDGRYTSECKFVRSWGNFVWGENGFVWNDPEITWSKAKSIRFKRHTPRGTSRAKVRQLIMSPAEIVIFKSDTYAIADITYVDPVSPSDVNVAMQGGVTWPDDILGYKIVFDTDNYVQEHIIDTVSGLNLVLAGSLTPAIGVKWQIVGKYKQSQVGVKAVTIRVANIDNEGGEFTSGGGNV